MNSARRVNGGRSPYYDARRAKRPASSAHAPYWSDAAARATIDGVDALGVEEGVTQKQVVLQLLASAAASRKFAASLTQLQARDHSEASSWDPGLRPRLPDGI